MKWSAVSDRERHCPWADGHFADEAAFVAALKPDDDVRRMASAHAAACAGCEAALEEGRALLALLRRTIGDAPPPRA